MKRVVLFTLWALLTISFADAAPARLLYQPKPRDQAPQDHALHGSTWEGTCFNSTCMIKLNGDGTLEFFSAGKKAKGFTTPSPGSWRLAGNEFFFDVNKYSEHRGTISGDVAWGDSSNKAGTQGKFRLQRVHP